MNNFNYTPLPPFKWYVLQNFPFIEADFDALTEWQLFCKLGKELQKIIDSTNSLGIQVESLTDYVNNYFENLDVEEEINNKLNEMAEDGTLEEIIARYLQQSSIKVTFLYRGDNKGDCSLIQTKDKNILIDLRK